MANRYLSEEHLTKLREREEYLRRLISKADPRKPWSGPITLGDVVNVQLKARTELAEILVEIEILEDFLSGE